MKSFSIRDLRNHGGDVIDGVGRGETYLVTRDGRPAAELHPVRRRPLPAAELLKRWRKLQAVDPVRFRRDIDGILDPSL